MDSNKEAGGKNNMHQRLACFKATAGPFLQSLLLIVLAVDKATQGEQYDMHDDAQSGPMVSH